MDTDDLNRMYAQIVNGIPKEESRFVTDDESGALWDQISKEVEEIKAKNPKAQFEIPNEVPTPGDPSEAPDAAAAPPAPNDAPPDKPEGETTPPPADKPEDKPEQQEEA